MTWWSDPSLRFSPFRSELPVLLRVQLQRVEEQRLITTFHDSKDSSYS